MKNCDSTLLANPSANPILTVQPLSLRIDIHLDGEIGTPSEYRDVLSAIRNCRAGDEVHVHLNTPGGNVASADQLWDALKQCHGRTHAHVHKAYSAGAMITMACEVIHVHAFARMMIHDVSGVLVGKLHSEIGKDVAASEMGEAYLNEIYGEFLTQQEKADVLKGIDLYISTKQISARLEKCQQKAKKGKDEKPK